jgi:cob(I)alamin adenosyltransferase
LAAKTRLIDYNRDMSNFFTRKGDDGTTGFLGKGRVTKSDTRIEALGELDEASAALGIVRAADVDPKIKEMVLEIQRDLYKIMAEVAASGENQEAFRKLTDLRINWLEQQIDYFSSKTKIPKEFILPGETPSAAAVSFARTVVRRAERRLVQLDTVGEKVNPHLLQYINRLSSLCFVVELFETNREGNEPTFSKGDPIR